MIHLAKRLGILPPFAVHAGWKARMFELHDHTHWYYDIAGFINQTAWDFMQQHRLPE